MVRLLLDLFCCAGGAGMGYHRAGFRVVGIDNRPQKRYPFEFVQADALEFCREHGGDFDAIHASPPCQHYSHACFTKKERNRHPDLVCATRTLLQETGRPYIIENVLGAPLRAAAGLCGLMFGLKVFRHRWFESNVLLMVPEHPSHQGKRIGKDGFRCPIGNGGWSSQRMRHRQQDAVGEKDDKASWQRAMGIDWMTRDEMAQAIPPAYTAYLGRQLRTRWL